MKKDKFKEFVSENRTDFDLYEHDLEAVWNKVDEKLENHRNKSRYSFMLKVAASIAIVMVAGIVVFNLRMNSQENSAMAIPAELSEAAFYYEGMINSKLELIKASNQQIDQDIFSDLEALDEAYKELKTDLKDNADNQEVVEAMIQNYKIKLEILESILDELERTDEENEDKTINNI